MSLSQSEVHNPWSSSTASLSVSQSLLPLSWSPPARTVWQVTGGLWGLRSHRVAKRLQICSSQTSASLASQSLVKGRVETETTKTSSQEWVRPHPAPPAALHSLKCQYIIYAHEWLSIIHTPDPTRTRLLTTTPCFSLITSNAVSTLDTSRAFGFQTHHKQIK